MTWISTLSSIGMAVGPPLVYADQAVSIVRNKDSSGFSRDANIARCFFWLGNRFEFPLLIQSILMILAQLALLYICIRYRPDISPESVGVSTRPYGFWQWPSYGTYIEFLAGLINYRQKSLYGFRMSTLLGWVGGDAYKTVYFFLQSSPMQFKVCAIFQLSVDFAIVAQRFYYGNKPPAILPDIDDIEQALRLAED
ncbi:hypothetical protein RhiTH_001285 [Rhizoctonia solani]